MSSAGWESKRRVSQLYVVPAFLPFVSSFSSSLFQEGQTDCPSFSRLETDVFVVGDGGLGRKMRRQRWQNAESGEEEAEKPEKEETEAQEENEDGR